MRERGEIAGGPDAALLRDDRMDAVGQEGQDRVDDRGAAAAVAQGQGVRPQEQHRPHDLARERRPDACGMAHQQVLLELAGLIRLDEGRREVAEPGRHAVDDRVLGHEALDDVAGLLHPLSRMHVERAGRPTAGDSLDIGDREVRPGQDHRVRPAGSRRAPRSG